MTRMNKKGHIARLNKKRELRKEGQSPTLIDVNFAEIEKRIPNGNYPMLDSRLDTGRIPQQGPLEWRLPYPKKAEK